MIIVTGGAGFIGSALVAALNAAGRNDLIVVDHLGSTEKWKNLRGKKFDRYFHKDEFRKIIRSGATIGSSPITAVVHLGACSSTTESDADYLIDNNFRYSQEICEWALEGNARFLYASSAAVYGDGALGFSDSDDTTGKLQPLNMYGYSKLLFDQWVLTNGLSSQVVGLRFFNVFGPNEDHKGDMTSVVYKAFYQIQATGKLKLFRSYKTEFADGAQERDFVYVKDCVRVMLKLLGAPAVNGIFNLGTGTPRCWNDLARAVFAAMNRNPAIEYIEMPEKLRSAYQYYTAADMNRLQQACPTTFQSLEAGVADYVQEYLLKSERL